MAKVVSRVQRMTASIAKPYAKRLAGPFTSAKQTTDMNSWFRNTKRTGLRKLVADRVRAERRAGYIKRGRKDY